MAGHRIIASARACVEGSLHVPGPVPAHRDTQSVCFDPDAQELVDLEHAWLEAARTRDIEFLERLLGEEFTLTTGRPGVEVRSRAEWLEVTRDSYAIDSFEFADIDARVYDDSALVRSHYRQRGAMGGEDRTTAYLMTDVLVRREGRWQAVARHITPLEQDPPGRGLSGSPGR